MRSVNKKTIPLLIIILAASSPMVIKTPSASDSIPKPYVPEFSLNFVDNSYTIPPRYGIDPYTGRNVTFEQGFYYVNRTIELSIRNQAFAPYSDVDGHQIGLYYNVSAKGHFQNEWGYTNWGQGYLSASQSKFTIVTFGLGGDNSSILWGNLWIPAFSGNELYGQIDFI